MRRLLGSLFISALLNAVLGADATRPLSSKPGCCAKELPAVLPLSDRSLYQLESSWTNDSGAALKLSAFRGRPQVVSMFFASCQFTCPILVNDIKRIEAALPENVRTNVGFVLVTFDSERDTPEALAAYRKVHGLPSNWTLLRGAPDDVLELAALLGVKYKKDFRGQFAHSNVITILDSGGDTVRQISGLNRDASDAVKAVAQAIAASDREKTTHTH